jgi:thiol:disulfide interchange protein DsbA
MVIKPTHRIWPGELLMKQITTIVLLLFFFSGATFAQSPKYQEGKHYFLIDQVGNQAPSNKPVAMEFFSYLCSHCNTFEPFVKNWRKSLPEQAEFKRIPVGFGRAQWEMYSKAYVAAEMMGIMESSHEAMFDELWKRQSVKRDMNEMADFYSQFGVTRDSFLATVQSFAVDAEMRKGQQLTRSFGIRGTPSMVVSGKYRIISGPDVPDYSIMLDVVSFLIDLELAAATSEQAVSGAAEEAATADS